MPTYTVGIGRTYSTIQQAVDAVPDDLSGGGVQNIEVYRNASWDGTRAIYAENVDAQTGFSNASANDYVAIRAMEDHEGQRETGVVVRNTATGNASSWGFLVAPYSRVEGFCFTHASTANYHVYGVVAADGTGCRIEKNIIYDLNTTVLRAHAIRLTDSGGGIRVKNNAIFSIFSASAQDGIGIIIVSGDATTPPEIFNNSIFNVKGTIGGYGIRQSGGTIVVKNNICADTTTANFSVSAPVGSDFQYNISEDDTADDWGGAGNQINQDPDSDIKFTSTTVGAEDVHLSDSSSVAFEAGVAVAGVEEDFEGGIRRASPCVGADEIDVPITIYAVGTGKTYSTIQAAVDAVPGNLADTGIHQIEVYRNGSWDGAKCYYTEQVDALTGFSNPSVSDFISLVAMEDHEGQRETGVVIKPTAGTGALFAVVNLAAYCRIDGFCLTISGTHNHQLQGVRGYSEPGHCIVENCISYDLETTASQTCYGFIVRSGAIIRNCVALNLNSGLLAMGFYTYGQTAPTETYFSVALNCEHYGFYDPTAAANTWKNNLAANCGTVDFGSAGSTTVEYCISSDATADNWGGAGNQINQDPTTDIKLTNVTPGAEDIHISDLSSVAYQAGVVIWDALEDIDGDARLFPPTIGADEPTALPTVYTVGTGKSYATIQGAVDAVPGSLNGTGIHQIEVYAGGVAVGAGYEYREQVDANTGFSGGGANDYISLVAMESHGGKRSQGIIINPDCAGFVGTFNCVAIWNYGRIDGFCVTMQGTHNNYTQGIDIYRVGTQAHNCIVHDLQTNNLRAYGITFQSGLNLVTNCVAMNLSTVNNSAIGFYGAFSAGKFLNCTSINTRQNGVPSVAYWNATGGSIGFVNCISVQGRFLNNGTAPTADYCISQDGTADDFGGTGNLVNQDPDTHIKFVSSTPGSEDVHLAEADSVAKGAGIAIGGVDTDFEGEARPDPPSIGADEYNILPVVPVGFGPFGNLNFLGGGIR